MIIWAQAPSIQVHSADFHFTISKFKFTAPSSAISMLERAHSFHGDTFGRPLISPHARVEQALTAAALAAAAACR
jgi:hypothetical protein